MARAAASGATALAGVGRQAPNLLQIARFAAGPGVPAGAMLTLHTISGRAMDDKLQQLPIDERIRLVEDLWDSIASDRSTLTLTPDQKAELDRRLDAYAVDNNRGRLAADAVADIRRRL
jgi:putative addiction module component (TIGR02574 family)